MGYFVPVPDVIDLLSMLNLRFAEGDAIVEMVALQGEFDVFAAKHDLRASFSLLGLTPSGAEARARWFKYLDRLHKFTSDLRGTSGHDRIRDSLRNDLKGAGLPVSFTTHDSKVNPGVTVTNGPAMIFSSVNYVIISVPTKPERRARHPARKAAARKPKA